MLGFRVWWFFGNSKSTRDAVFFSYWRTGNFRSRTIKDDHSTATRTRTRQKLEIIRKQCGKKNPSANLSSSDTTPSDDTGARLVSESKYVFCPPCRNSQRPHHTLTALSPLMTTACSSLPTLPHNFMTNIPFWRERKKNKKRQTIFEKFLAIPYLGKMAALGVAKEEMLLLFHLVPHRRYMGVGKDDHWS